MKIIYYLTYGEYKNLGYAKIGETNDLKKRISSLCSAFIDEPDIYTVSVSDNISDKQIHRFMIEKCNIKHIKNEWFECTPEQFFEVIKNYKQLRTDNTPLEKTIELQLYKNKINEKGHTCTVNRIKKILEFSGIDSDYESLIGKILVCELVNHKRIKFSINKKRAYCGVKINKEYFPSDYELLYIISAKIINGPKSLF